MSEVDEWDIAHAMIRLYGRKAETMAESHADNFAKDGDIPSFKRWQRVKEIVSRLKPLSSATKQTRH